MNDTGKGRHNYKGPPVGEKGLQQRKELATDGSTSSRSEGRIRIPFLSASLFSVIP